MKQKNNYNKILMKIKNKFKKKFHNLKIKLKKISNKQKKNSLKILMIQNLSYKIILIKIKKK